jgi:GxxExxY protein
MARPAHGWEKESLVIYEEETELLRRGFFDVQNEVGLGHREEVYHRAMAHWLKQRGIPYVSKAPLALLIEGRPAHTLYPDLTVWSKITIELKSLPRHLREPEQVQMFNYLKRQHHTLGLLVNMGLDRVHVRRIVHEAPAYEWSEDWGAWRDRIDGGARTMGIRVRDLLRSLYDVHQTGYGSEVVESLIHAALQDRDIRYAKSPVAASVFQGCRLGVSPRTSANATFRSPASLAPSVGRLCHPWPIPS